MYKKCNYSLANLTNLYQKGKAPPPLSKTLFVFMADKYSYVIFGDFGYKENLN